ncbi:hypothetical protein VUR80DRAFT_1024 [Thermomyces stellatus]
MSSDSPEPSSTIESPLSTPSTFSTSATSSTSRTTTGSPSSDFTPALTKPWTRPETCGYTHDVDHRPREGAGQTAYLDWAIDEGATTFSCYPPGMFESGNSGTFSPASCPFSWYTVDKPDGSESSEKQETTTRTCCSKDYTLHDGFCQKAIPTILATPVTHITDASSTSSSYMTEMTTYLVGATVAHHPLVILFQEKDQDILGLVDDDLAHSDAPSATSTSFSSGNGLGLGAKVGIAVGVAGVVSILVLLAYYLLRRRRHLSEKASLETAVLPRSAPACRSSASSSAASLQGVHARRQVEPDPDPPPAYEPSLRQLSPRGSVDGAELSGDELRSLRAQQEAIRRRIEQLERGSGG